MICWLSRPSATYHFSPEEVGLLGLAEVRDSHVGQHFLLQDLPGVLDPLVLGDARLGSAGSDEVQSDVLLLDDERLVQRGLHLENARQGAKSRWSDAELRMDDCVYKSRIKSNMSI